MLFRSPDDTVDLCDDDDDDGDDDDDEDDDDDDDDGVGDADEWRDVSKICSRFMISSMAADRAYRCSQLSVSYKADEEEVRDRMG